MQAPPLYIVRSFGLRDIVENNYNINIPPSEEKKYYIKQADCQYFRLIRDITGVTTRFNPYVIFVDINYHKDIEEVISHIVFDGIRVRGVRFVLGERSASMVRQGVLSFVDEYIAPELNKRITMDLDISTTVLSKWQAYRGLVLSSCHCIEGYCPKMIVVKDMKTVIPGQHVRYIVDEHMTFTNDEGKEVEWTQKGIESGVNDVRINAFDGTGFMSHTVAKRIEEIIGSTTPITSCIFRMQFIKGCIHVIDYEKFFEERGVEYIQDIWGKWHSIHEDMVILTESMYKGYSYFKKYGDSRDWDRYWEKFHQYNHCIGIAKANFTQDEETVYTRSNYQILQTLDLPYEKFRSLADVSVEWINKVMDEDEMYTKCFLGIMSGKCNALNPYVAAIAKNSAMLKETSVRRYLLSLVSKYLDEMKTGKLYIKSCFKFLAPDLIALLEHIGGLEVKGCLEEDEFWSNSKWCEYKGEYLITRNPHICKSENVILKAKSCEEIERWIGHLSNVCMINIKSLTPQRLNGADYDGDLVLINDNQTMIEGVDRNATIVIDVDDKITAIEEPDIPENRIKCILRTTKSMIGEFSNYASAYHNRMPSTEEQKKRYRDYIDIISVLTGKSIDKRIVALHSNVY